jgi:hypothetical protein
MSGLSPQPLEDTFEPKPALRNATTVGLQAGIVGAFVSAVQNALGSHSRGAAGFLTRSGGTIGTFGKRTIYLQYESVNVELHLHSCYGRCFCVHGVGCSKSTRNK